MTSQSGTHSPKDPVAWWRQSYERDKSAFERAHGRKPESLHELSKWLQPKTPARVDSATH